ncbi:MAG: signal peptidase I, partial [Rhodothermaceae bacterium]|nr:signal peptidase I [Rhodothermaceae bacterium]
MPTTETRRKERAKRRAARDQARGQADANGKAPKNKKATGWKETLRFWVISIFVIVVVRAFLFEPYRIPSESMEDTLLVGDFLLVSKLHYGPRTPNTLGIPLTPIYLRGIQFPQTRLPGFSEPQRGDVIVFNYPASQDVVRGRVPSTVPIERRDPYIKRLVGLPGDTVAVLDKVVYLNGAPQPLAPTQKQTWEVTSAGNERVSTTAFEDMDIEFLGDLVGPDGRPLTPRRYRVIATPAEVEGLRARTDVAAVEPVVLPEGAMREQPFRFPPGSASNPDQFPPVVVPRAGETVPLTRETWPGLAEIITRYEGHEVQV